MLNRISERLYWIWQDFMPLFIGLLVLIAVLGLVFWAVAYDAKVEQAKEDSFVEYCMRKVQSASEEDCRWEYQKNYKAEKKQGTTMMPIIIPMR